MRTTRNGVRKRPPLLRALGLRDPPGEIEVGRRSWRLDRIYKHDSWAATASYRDAGGAQIIAKFNRTEPVFGVPMGWVGDALATREAKFLRRLAHVEGVPNDLGPVTAGGRRQRNAIARAFIEGEPFTEATPVDPPFFMRLRVLLDALHAAGVAYVDLHKRENILIDPEGRPHLVDFQVSFGPERGWSAALARPILRALEEMDDYHWRKHYHLCLPETLSDEEMRRFRELPWFIRAHRLVALPLRILRRRLLVWMKVRDRTGRAPSELEPEDALRRR